LLSYSDNEASALLGALHDARPSLSVSGLVEQVAPKTGKSAAETTEIVRTLVNLFSVYAASMSTSEQFAASVVQTLVASGKSELKPSGGDWQPFRQRLVGILSLDKSLGVTAKARDARLEYPRAFCECRVWTDLRPIFGASVGECPAGTVAVHTLRITYHESGSHKDFYVALDKPDLLELKRQLERALQKEESLKGFLSGTAAAFLGAEI
jgi:hypothetical protein